MTLINYTTEEKPCTNCGEVGAPYPKGSNKRKPGGKCYTCVTEKQKEWADNNKIRHSRNQFFRLLRRYALTVEEFDELLIEWRGLCPICLEELNPPCVEHCHDTGRVRGLTCRQCNTAMGQANDDPERLRRMADYLEDML